jgi:Zinc-binding dehydrogenase
VLAAAGGVGQLVTQMVKAAGGRVIGLVSRQEKTDAAAAAGADHVLVSSGGGFQDTVRELTGGPGADVVYDNGGTATFSSSQLALRRHGVHAFYGNLMGVPTLQPTDLSASILLTYPRCSTMCLTKTACGPASAMCSTWSSTATLLRASSGATTWPTRRRPTAISPRAGPPASCCCPDPPHRRGPLTR